MDENEDRDVSELCALLSRGALCLEQAKHSAAQIALRGAEGAGALTKDAPNMAASLRELRRNVDALVDILELGAELQIADATVQRDGTGKA